MSNRFLQEDEGIVGMKIIDMKKEIEEDIEGIEEVYYGNCDICDVWCRVNDLIDEGFTKRFVSHWGWDAENQMSLAILDPIVGAIV